MLTRILVLAALVGLALLVPPSKQVGATIGSLRVAVPIGLCIWISAALSLLGLFRR